MSIDINDLEWRIDLIEEEIEDMKENQEEVVLTLKVKVESLEAEIDKLRGIDNDTEDIGVVANIPVERRTTPEK